MFDDESRRRQFLRWTAIAGGVGLAGCGGNGSGSGTDEDDDEDDEETETETDTETAIETESATATEEPEMSVPQVQFEFEYEASGGAGNGAVTVTHGGGDSVPAGNLRIASGGGEDARWSDLSGTSATDEVTAGDSVTVSGENSAWPSDVAYGESLTVAFVADGEAMATLGEFSAPDGPSIASEIEVDVWGDFAEALDLVKGEYESDTNSTITVNRRSETALRGTTGSDLRSGSGAPPLTMMTESDSGSWIETDGLRDLSGRIEQAGIREQFVDGAWEAYEQGDGTFAVPWTVEPAGFYYRNDLLDEMGYDLDGVRTWDDVFFQLQDAGADAEEAGIVDSAEDLYLFGIPENQPDVLWRLLTRQQGGDSINDDGQITLTSGESVQAVETMQQLYQDGLAETIDLFSDSHFEKLGDRGPSQHLLSFGGPSFEHRLATQLDATAGEWRIWAPPAFGDEGSRATSMGGTALIIPSQASEAAASRAWNFINWAIPDSGRAAQMFRQHGVFTAYEDAYISSAFGANNGSSFLGGQSPGNFFSNLAPNISGYSYTADEPVISEAINDNILDAVTEGGSPDEVLLNAADEVATQTGRDIA
jgi:ABC-type glycerol-3-phosphate transport system substrate-binding protein